MAKRTASERTPEPKPEAKSEVQELRKSLLEAATAEFDELAELLAGTTDATILGHTEYLVRDIVHRVGAKAIETALRERKKGGTLVPA